MTTDKKPSQRETLAMLFEAVQPFLAIAVRAAAENPEQGIANSITGLSDATKRTITGSELMLEQRKNDERWRVAHRSIRAMFKAVGATDPGRFETPNHTLVDLGRLREWMELPGPDSFHAHAARLKEMGITMVR